MWLSQRSAADFYNHIDYFKNEIVRNIWSIMDTIDKTYYKFRKPIEVVNNEEYGSVGLIYGVFYNKEDKSIKFNVTWGRGYSSTPTPWDPTDFIIEDMLNILERLEEISYV